MQELLKDLGEKEIIKSIIKPLFNPRNLAEGVGDDCAVIDIAGNKSICISTDRVPADLVSFKIGLIDYYELGYYLSVLNLSDIASAGAKPIGLMLTFAFENDFKVSDLKQILKGVKDCCEKYNCKVLGGDLSNSSEMSISATSIGMADSNKVLYRSKAKEGDCIFCSDYIGITPTAFKYFLELKPSGYSLGKTEENFLAEQFRLPKAKVELGRLLSDLEICTSCMDNTDGISQTFCELSEINNIKFCIDIDKMPIHEITYKIANKLNIDVVDIIFSAGADFQLLGTVDENLYRKKINRKLGTKLNIIGKTEKGRGLFLTDKNKRQVELYAQGWNYYNK
jgi:thiamine-monophosphate kinase